MSPSLNMGATAHELNDANVKKLVADNKMGNYAFGNLNSDGVLLVYYVGRSDTDLKTEIIKQAKNKSNKGYTHFKYSYADSADEAYNKECANFHDFEEGGLHNEIHPDVPDGRDDLDCPHGCGYKEPKEES